MLLGHRYVYPICSENLVQFKHPPTHVPILSSAGIHLLKLLPILCKKFNLLLFLGVNIHFFLQMLWFLQVDQYRLSKLVHLKGHIYTNPLLSVNSLFPLPTLNILSGIPQVEQTHWKKIITTSRFDNRTQPLSLSKSKFFSMHDIFKMQRQQKTTSQKKIWKKTV